jgi:hypothetical protein
VRALGELLYLLVTGRRVDGGAIKLLGVGEPLRTVIRHALVEDPRGRWTLEEISAALERPVAPAPPESTPAAAIESPARTPGAQKPAPPPFPKWIFAGLAGLLLIIVAMNVGRKSGAGTVPGGARNLRHPATRPASASGAAPVQQAVRAAAPPSIKKAAGDDEAGSAIWRHRIYLRFALGCGDRHTRQPEMAGP